MKRFQTANRSLLKSCVWLSLFPLLFLAEAGRGQGVVNWLPSLDRAFPMAKERNRPLLVYFYDPGEKWCFTMEFYTFCNRDVAAAIHASFLPVRLLNKDNSRLSKDYRIRRLPTILFLTPSGEEIDRAEKFVDSEPFLQLLKRILKGENTFMYWKRRAENAAHDPMAWFQLAERYLSRNRNAEAQRYYERILLLSSVDPPLLQQEAELGYAFSVGQSGRDRKALSLLEEFCEKHPQSPLLPKAEFSIGLNHLFSNKEKKAEKKFREVAMQYGETPWGKKALIMAEEMKIGREKEEPTEYVTDWESNFLGNNFHMTPQEEGKKKKKKKK